MKPKFEVNQEVKTIKLFHLGETSIPIGTRGIVTSVSRPPTASLAFYYEILLRDSGITTQLRPEYFAPYYSDLDLPNIGINTSSKAYELYRYRGEKIRSLLDSYRNKTGMQSISNYDYPEIEEIVSMGKPVVNFLIHEMCYRGDVSRDIFYLLGRITGAHPIAKEHRGYHLPMLNDWLTWYLASDYYKQDDIYHNLVLAEEVGED